MESSVDIVTVSVNPPFSPLQQLWLVLLRGIRVNQRTGWGERKEMI